MPEVGRTTERTREGMGWGEAGGKVEGGGGRAGGKGKVKR